MNSILFLISTAFFLQSTWQEHTDQAGRFSILLPGDFTEKTDSVQTDVGILAYHTFYLQATEEDAENLFYMVSYCDYPPSVAFSDSTDLVTDFFKNTIEAAAETMHGEVTYSAGIQLDTHPGKQWRIDYLDGKAVVKNRAYLVGNRFYSLQTISWKEKSMNADGTRFFDSFKLITL